MRATHDVHIHNYLSSCSGDNGATPESFLKICKENGLKLMGFANHTWDESIPLPAPSGFYTRQSMAFQMQIKSQVPKEYEGMKVLVGVETEYCGMYDVLGMGKEAAEQLDFVLIPHTHVHMRNFVMPATDDVKNARNEVAEIFAAIKGITPERARAIANSLPEAELEPFMKEKKVDYIKFVSDFMVESFRKLMDNETLKEYSDIVPVSVAHPFQPVGSWPQRPDMVALISDDTFGELFEIAAKRGIGLEINSSARTPETQRICTIAKACGCKFTLGSDAHSRDVLKTKIFETDIGTDALGLTEYDFMDFVRV